MVRSGLIFTLCTLLTFSDTKAQKTLMDEVSASYLDTLLLIAKENYPRVQALNEEIRVSQNNLIRTKLSWFDLIGIYYFYTPQRTTPDISDPYFLSGFQVGLSLNVGTFIKKPSEVRVSKSQLEISRFQKSEYLLNLEANVKDRYYRYLERLALVKLRTQAVLDADGTLSFMRSRFERGQETLERYNIAQALVNEQNREKTTAESELLSAKAFLEELVGKKLEEIKGVK